MEERAQPPRREPGEVGWWDAPAGAVLWGVYGPTCFPTVFACKLRDYSGGERAIWGFSVYEGQPGFRTLGVSEAWAEEHALRLFTSRVIAFNYIAGLFKAALSPEKV